MTYNYHPFEEKRICNYCKKEFTAHTINNIYCKNCRKSMFKSFGGITCATIGAISELMVSADLLKKGYEVFRAVSPSCSCDLAILRDTKADIIAIVIHKESSIVYEPKL